MNAPTTTSSPKERLMADLRLVIADAEELLKLSAGQAGDKAAELRRRVQERMDSAKDELARLQSMAAERARDAGKAADNFVHDNPWKAVGIAAGAGLLLGLLLSRR
jgi:ElaB/YqjD/DUF883 family membrane-anchored ribosome-binding protein